MVEASAESSSEKPSETVATVHNNLKKVMLYARNQSATNPGSSLKVLW